MRKILEIKIVILSIAIMISLSSCTKTNKNINPTLSPTQLDVLQTQTPISSDLHTSDNTPSPTPYYFATINPNPTAAPTAVPIGENVVNPFRIYDSSSLEFDILSLSDRYSEILQYEIFGQSYMGKNLYVLKLGKGQTKFLVTGATHARENITTNYIMRTVEEYAKAYVDFENYEGIDVRTLLGQFTIYYVPAINIDGIDIVNLLKDPIDNPEKPAFSNIDDYAKITWKANARGVDLNKNYPYFFDEVITRNPKQYFSSMDYHGPYAGSEPETHAMMNLSESNDFQFCINLHSKGKVMYWRDDGNGIIEGDERLAKLINKQTGYVMVPSTTSPLSYGGGHENWFRFQYKRPAICLELTAGNDGAVPYNIINRSKYDLKEYDYYGKSVLDWDKTKTLMLILARDYFEIK